MIFALGAMAIAYILTRLSMPIMINFLYRVGSLQESYQGRLIPVSSGLVFVPVSLLLWIGITFWQAVSELTMIAVSLGAVTVVLSALMDDFWGSSTVKGLRGHLSELGKGRLTTGLLKALTGLITGIYIAYFLDAKIVWLSGLVVALSINTVNLLDLRPGRAGKYFLIIGISLFFLKYGTAVFVLAPVIGAVLAYLPFDLRGKVMLGDVGSNFLGFVLGSTSIVILDYSWQLVLLVILLLLHWYTEHHSLSGLIASKPLLRKVDYLGRAKSNKD